MAFVIVWIGLSHGGLDHFGKPLGTDFLSFWAASKLALDGHADDAYSPAAHAAIESAAFGGADLGYAAFFYPPVFLLICLPLALLPYMASLSVWLGLTGLAYWRVVRMWLDRRAGALPIFAFPAVYLNVAHGQTAFLASALFGAGALTFSTRPILAGVFFGALSFKPHLGLLIPVALLAARQWATMASAACTAMGLALLSQLVFGQAVWVAFLEISPLARTALESELVGSAKMQSVFAAVRLWGGSVSLGYFLQIVVGLVTAATIFAVARRRPSAGPLRDAPLGATLICGTLLTSPFLLDYDLTLAAIPLAWLFSAGLRYGFRPWEKTALCAAYILPLISRLVAMKLGVPLAPFILAALFIVVVRRAWNWDAGQAARRVP